ncbi:MAG TPA: DUF167 family protein [Myxococcota bacterium]|nr:DUF167 family protein [Myxococcota bacterium]
MTDPPAGLNVGRAAGGIVFRIHVTPRARRPSVGGTQGDALRVAVSAPPVEGKANAACAAALAEALDVPRSSVRLDPSARGRRKRVEVEGDAAELERRLRILAERP